MILDSFFLKYEGGGQIEIKVESESEFKIKFEIKIEFEVEFKVAITIVKLESKLNLTHELKFKLVT